MKFSYQASNPREIEMTMTVTMTLFEWTLVAEALAGGDRAAICINDFRARMRNAIRNASADFGEEHCSC